MGKASLSATGSAIPYRPCAGRGRDRADARRLHPFRKWNRSHDLRLRARTTSTSRPLDEGRCPVGFSVEPTVARRRRLDVVLRARRG